MNQFHVQSYICVIYRPGGPYWEKLWRLRAILKSEGTVFHTTHRPRPVNIFSAKKQGQGSWTNSVHYQNQSDYMIYRIPPAHAIRKKLKGLYRPANDPQIGPQCGLPSKYIYLSEPPFNKSWIRHRYLHQCVG